MRPIRRTLKRIEESGHARYLTFWCYRRLPLFKNHAIKQLFVDQLAITRARLDFELYAWVVMPEHLHLLVMPALPATSVTQILHALKRPLSSKVLARWREINANILDRVCDNQGQSHFWQVGGGYDRNIISDRELYEKVNDIHANPVRRGLAHKPGDWPWSSARWYERREGMTMDTLPL